MIRRECATDTTQHSSSYPLDSRRSRNAQPAHIPCTNHGRESPESAKGILGHEIHKKVVYEVDFAEGGKPQPPMRGW